MSVRFGFIGAGWIAGKALAPAVHAADGAVLQAVAAREPERARLLEPVGRVYADYADLLADDAVDAVYISLSNEAHLPWVLAALAAGKHVLCEKPLGLSTAQVEQMVTAAEQSGRLLVEAFWYRWHPRTRRMQELVESGALGEVRSVTAQFAFRGAFDGPAAGNYRLDPARGGGALYDVGCYAISAAHLALGSALEVASAHADLMPSGVDATTTATVRSSRGGGVLHASIFCPPGAQGQALRVVGEEASVELTRGEAFATWREPSALTVTAVDGQAREETFAAVDAYQVMVEAFAQRVRSGEGWLPAVGHSLDVARTADAIRAVTAT